MGEWAGRPFCRTCLSVISRVTYRENSMGVGTACLAQGRCNCLVPWTVSVVSMVLWHGMRILWPQSGAVVMRGTQISANSEAI